MYPSGRSREVGALVKSVSAASRSEWGCAFPVVWREAEVERPKVWRAAWAAAMTSGWCARAR